MSGVGKTVWKIAPGQEHFTNFLLELHRTFPDHGTTIYKARNELKEICIGSDVLVVKAFAVPMMLRRLIYGRIRLSKAQKSFENSMRLLALGVTTPTPVGFIEHHRVSGLFLSFYVSHTWPNARTIRDPLTKPDYPDRLEILECFGRFAWTLHQKGVYHRDFSPGNILFSNNIESINTPESDTDKQPPVVADLWRFCLVDVNRLKFETLSLDARMENFKMLWADDQDLAIIVSAYAKASGEEVSTLVSKAIAFSSAHKARASRKERIKTLLRLH